MTLSQKSEEYQRYINKTRLYTKRALLYQPVLKIWLSPLHIQKWKHQSMKRFILLFESSSFIHYIGVPVACTYVVRCAKLRTSVFAPVKAIKFGRKREAHDGAISLGTVDRGKQLHRAPAIL